jgi:NTE family protein
MFLPVEIEGRSYIDGMLAYAVPTTPLRRMGAEFVLGVHLSAHWSECRTPRHLFEVIGQCFSIAQARMSDVWKKDADMVLEPDVRGFSYDCFDCAKELIAIGESSARSIVPQLRELLNIGQTVAAVAPIPVGAADASQTTVVA